MLEEMMPRWVPTENVNGFEICPGLYRDEGATAFQSAVNFTVHSKGAVTCELLLFHRKEPEPYAVIPFPENCRILKNLNMRTGWTDRGNQRKVCCLIKSIFYWIRMQRQLPDRVYGEKH